MTTATQQELVRCSSCRRDYELTRSARRCPACGGASWVAARIAERDAGSFRSPDGSSGLQL